VISKKESSEQMIHLLLKAGANPNTIRFKQVNTIKTYETSLHIAIIAQNIKVVLLLVAYGANISIPLIEAGKIIPVEELCETEAMCKAVFTGWTPETHKIYPEKIRKEIFLLFLISQRQDWLLPKELLFLICNFIAICTK